MRHKLELRDEIRTSTEISRIMSLKKKAPKLNRIIIVNRANEWFNALVRFLG